MRKLRPTRLINGQSLPGQDGQRSRTCTSIVAWDPVLSAALRDNSSDHKLKVLRGAGGGAQGHSGLQRPVQTSWCLPSLSLCSMAGPLPQGQLILRTPCTFQALRGLRHLGKSGLGILLEPGTVGSGLPTAQLSTSPSVLLRPSGPPRAGTLAARWHCDLAERPPPEDSPGSGEKPPLPRGRADSAFGPPPLRLPGASPAAGLSLGQAAARATKTGGSKSSP